jgi:predicted nucleic acid-binding Zn ribbon protein
MKDRGRRARSRHPKGEPGRDDPFHRVSDVLEGVISQLGLTEELKRQDALFRWEGLVGERIARVTRASSISRGVLFVRVGSSAWLNELNLMRHELLARLNAGRTEGRIERIVFTLSGGEEPSAESPRGDGAR